MSYERRDFKGGAAATTLASGINATDATISIASAAGWPSGTNGHFFVCIDAGTASEEKIRCSTRVGTSLTVVASTGRGSDDTTAASHSAGAPIIHCATALDDNEANYAVAETVGLVTTAEDLLVGTGANALKRLGKGSNGQLLQVTAGALAYGALATGAVSSNTMLAAGVVNPAALASDAVTTVKILDANVTTAKLAAAAVDETKLAASVAGNGLAGGAGTALSVGVDGSTIEVTADTLNVKASGITATQLATGAVTSAKILDGTIATADLADGLITTAKLAALRKVVLVRNANQSIPDGVITDVSWDVETSDLDGFITATAVTLTVPTGLGGIWAITARWHWASSINNDQALDIVAAGVAYRTGHQLTTIGDNISHSITVVLAATDTVKASVFQLSGGAVNGTGQLQMYRVGP